MSANPIAHSQPDPAAEHADQVWLDRLVARITGAGLSAPAIMALELFKPLALFGGQLLLFLEPLATPVGRKALAHWSGLLAQPEAVESLLQRLETAHSTRDR
jgi:hypothetical protein